MGDIVEFICSMYIIVLILQAEQKKFNYSGITFKVFLLHSFLRLLQVNILSYSILAFVLNIL